MNPPFTNALRAITGERRDYPDIHQVDATKAALEALDEFAALLESVRLMPVESDITPTTELQARIEMRVNELRELIATGEITT